MDDFGYHKRIPRKKSSIRPYNKPRRVQWARNHQHWTFEDWLRIIWTDESSFSTAGFNCRPMVICYPGEEYHPDCIDETFEQERESRMAWGGFCGRFKTKLYFVPSKTKIDGKSYRDGILIPYLFPFWEEMCEEYGWVKVVEDGAPGHKGVARQYRNDNGMDCFQWPAQSPDLNLIEALWGDMEVELGHIWGRCATPEELEGACHQAWDMITPERLENLIRSLPARLQAVIDVNGNATPY